MARDKMSKKELKNPDAFQTQAYAFIDWAIKNRDILTKAGIVIVSVLVVFSGWYLFSKSAAEGRRAELAVVDDVRLGEIKVVQKQAEELQKKLTELRVAEAAKKKPEEEKPAESKPNPEIEKIEAQLKDLKPDNTKSLVAYKELGEKYPSNPVGWRAKSLAANILIDQEKFDEAIALLKEVLDASVTADFYQVHIGLLLGELYEEKGNWDEALSAIENTIKSAGNDHKYALPKALWAKSRVLKASGKNEEAVKVLEVIINDHNSAEQAQKARAARNIW